MPVDPVHQREQQWLAQVYRGDRLRELTIRSAVLGAFLAALMVTLNVYMGLKTGFGEGGALISCILGFALMKALGQVDRKRDPFTPLELNASQTMAGAAGSLGAIDNVIPALFMLGGFTGAAVVLHRPDGTALIPTWWEIMLWCLFTSMLGVTVAVPLRRQMVVAEELRFPTGTAAAETIRTLFSRGESSVRQAVALALAGSLAMAVTFLRDADVGQWVGERAARWIRPHSSYSFESVLGWLGSSWTPALLGCPLGSLTVGLAVSPMLFGAGFLVGPRIGASLVLGACVAWLGMAPALERAGVLAEIAAAMGTETSLQYSVVVKWTMWPALGMMLASAVGSMAFRWRVVGRAFSSMLGGVRGGAASPTAHLELPLKVWLGGMLVAVAGIELLLVWRFGVAWWVGLLAVPVAFVLAAIAVRAAGETDLALTGTVGKVTQLFFAGVHPGHVDANLLSAGISTGAAGEAAYMMTDLKAGHLLGSTPRRLAYAQYIGILAGALIATPVFLLFLHTYGIFNDDLPATSALVWSGFAQLMAEGTQVLPRGAGVGFAAGLGLGLVLAANDVWAWVPRRWTPSAMGTGLALMLPMFYSVTLGLGALTFVVLRRWARPWLERYGGMVAAGAIAGEGFGGLLVAILMFTGLL
jgi:uncharacterized oligopeptide transporter (OPT) family protein